ncbi:hypothetical protein BD309DRAFT_1020830 [Dichomitus squalens]|nr:hypothetical protein BD309DRAFT_1020830 [Dichomitus squalens]
MPIDEELGSIGQTGYYEGWTECADALRERDEDNVKAMSDELDAFLAFSGIFSAVITLFVGQSVTSLQPDNTQAAVDILRTISQQIGNQSAATVGLKTEPFQSSIIDIALNALLNAGLLCSLIASGMSLWVKQWLREYVLDEPSLPRSRVRVRLYRYHGLRMWHIRGSVACISILLQLSVLLFSTGVVMLAHKLNTTLSWILLALNGAWWAVTWGCAIVAAASANCPYKSPLSRAIFRLGYHFRQIFGSRVRFLRESNFGKYPTFEKRELEKTELHSTKLELEALTFANRELWGSDRLTRINECFREFKARERPLALKHIEKILRAHYSLETSADTFEWPGQDRLVATADKVVKQLMRIWCDIFVEHYGEKARVQSLYRLFYSVSQGEQHLSHTHYAQTEEVACGRPKVRGKSPIMSDGGVTVSVVPVNPCAIAD